MEDDVDAGGEQAGGQQAFGEVLQAVGVVEAEGAHGSGEDDGDGKLREGALDVDARLGHGVGAVGDDDGAGGGE